MTTVKRMWKEGGKEDFALQELIASGAIPADLKGDLSLYPKFELHRDKWPGMVYSQFLAHYKKLIKGNAYNNNVVVLLC
jgi:hypothetical protein